MISVAVTSKSFSKNEELCLELLKLYPDAKFNDKQITFDNNSLIEFLGDVERAIIGLEKINESVLQSLPKLKVISKYGVGIDTLDLDAMKRHGVSLGWTPGINKRSVSELVIAQMINVLRYLYESNQDVKLGSWKVRKSHQLSTRVVGIIGLGHIGQDLASLLSPFGCRIVANDIANRDDVVARQNIEMMSLDKLLSISDIVTIHVPLDKTTKGLINLHKIRLMKPDALLINYARGAIVDQQALAEALESRKLGGAVFDVFDQEPPTDFALINHPRFFASGHIGGSSFEAIMAMGMAAIDGLKSSLIHNQLK